METNNKDARLIITNWKGKRLSLLMQDGKLCKVQAEDPDAIRVGDIYIGKVKNIVKNIHAAFVDIGDGTLCFLPLDKIREPILTNRVYDGRVLAGDEIVLQIVREAMKTKEAAGDTNLSFTGKYAVVTTGKKQIGFSGKLTAEKRNSLEKFIKERFKNFPFGLIVRTNAGSLEDFFLLEQEILTLKEQAEKLLEYAATRTCFSRLRAEEPIWLTALRDTYREEYRKIVTDDASVYAKLKEYVRSEFPENVPELEYYEDPSLSLSKLYGLEGRLNEAFTKNVWLNSGAYLVIEPTEAMTVIDVNTGKFMGKKAVEDTFFQINKEACKEIARQLILRNLSGIIVVDFINMKSEKHCSELMGYLQALLKQDSVQTNVVDMTALGLVEITRKKVSKSLAEQLL